MNVVVVDQDPVTRTRLKRRLAKIPGIAVVGEASESEEAAAMIANRKPGIVILDTELKHGSGIEVLRHIKQLLLHPTVIMVTNQPSPELECACAVAGADFFFDKSREDRKVVATVRLLCTPEPGHDLSDPAGTLPD
ncbi:MAG TPA: response regulator transcription factor [Nitrospira sp.]|nr:response regulator transcription factor [Nitrospira sp.]